MILYLEIFDFNPPSEMKLFSLIKLFELYKFPFLSGFLNKIWALFPKSTVGKHIYGIFTNSSLVVVGSLNFIIYLKFLR